LEGFFYGAKDEIRTRDPDLGKVVLYQLSYFRIGVYPVKQVQAFYCAANIQVPNHFENDLELFSQFNHQKTSFFNCRTINLILHF
jgi:hypothetical protein